jgi:hypothetical protein
MQNIFRAMLSVNVLHLHLYITSYMLNTFSKQTLYIYMMCTKYCEIDLHFYMHNTGPYVMMIWQVFRAISNGIISHYSHHIHNYLC